MELEKIVVLVFKEIINKYDMQSEIISENETDYAVFDMRGKLADETTTIRQQHLMAGYIIETEVENYIIIMRHPDYQPAHFTQGE